MPWNDKSGGGGGPWGGGGGNNQGPWGQGPKGPSGPQGSPPDLEKLGGNLGKLAVALREIEPNLSWNNQSERRKSAVLAENYADSFIVGPRGFVPSSRVEIGVSVMAPHTTYPDHRHPPEELYLVLSQGEWRQNADAWHEPGVGGVVYNPANIVHAMRANAKPLFAIWCLPLDNGPHS